MIRISSVRVIDEEGNQLGVMPTANALRMAQERGFDLVEVAPTASPPVTRLLDYGQFKYEQARKEKEARRHQKSVEFKEVRLRVKIGKGDFDTKVKRAIRFLSEGDRVKVAVQFRGREVSHAYIGRDLLDRFAEQVAEYGSVDRAPVLEGRSMSMVLTSTGKVAPQPVKSELAQKKSKQAPPGAEPTEAEPPQAESTDAEPPQAESTDAEPPQAEPPVAQEEPEASPASSTGG
jgi:translation initiation factor IF-3